jgi:transcription elongation factor GreA
MTKTFYLTKEGLKKLKAEYEDLKRLQKTEHEEAPTLLEGDALNPDYSFYKENIDGLEQRLEELDNILKNYTIIRKPGKKEEKTVQIGAKVVLKNGSTEKEEFKIVGTLEANPFEGKISDESPIGSAFLGKQVGDTIALSNNINYKILKIQYEES